MRDDLDFEGTAQGNGARGLDIFDETFGSGPPPEADTGPALPPPFPLYHLRMDAVELRIANNEAKTPRAHITWHILGGPEGTVGRKAFVDMTLGASKEGKTPEQYDAAVAKIRKGWERAVYALQFDKAKPSNGDLQAWLNQGIGKEVIGGLGIDNKRTTPASNMFPSSLRRTDEPMKDAAKKPTGKTALQASQEAVANFGKRRTRGGGLTARDLGTRRDEFA